MKKISLFVLNMFIIIQLYNEMITAYMIFKKMIWNCFLF